MLPPPLGDYDLKTFKDPSEYTEAFSHACQEVGHFPKEIPPWAKNVLLYKPNDCWFGSEYFSLSFEIDKGCIDYEFNRYKFIETEGPFSTDEEYSDNYRRELATKQVGLKKAGFKFYVIDIKKNWNEYGIAVNDKTNRILYYSILLD